MKTLRDFPVRVPDGFVVRYTSDYELQVSHGVFAHIVGVEPPILATLPRDEEPIFASWLQENIDKAVANINAARVRYSA